MTAPVCRALGALLAALVLVAPLAARAHRGSSKYVIVEPTSEGARIEVQVELVDAAVELGMGEDASHPDVIARSADIASWLARGISLRGESGACETTPGDVRPIEGEDVARIAVELVARCPSPSGALTLRDETIFTSDAQHEAFVRMRFGDGSDARVLRAGRQECALGEAPSTGSLVWRFLVEGVRHLLTGYDHLLFLLSLVLTSGELARREGRRKALADVAWVVTAFTFGHSITLVSAALGVLVLPTRLVESVIAGSIVVVAVANIARPEARRGMPWLALGFGLVHGFGFSGVLAELGLPAEARVLSLLAFNVGIELAQLALVAMAIVPLERLARLPGYRTWIVRGGSTVIALLATFWMIERITER